MHASFIVMGKRCWKFKGEVGEQATLFFLDPSGNALQFRLFQQDDAIFAF